MIIQESSILEDVSYASRGVLLSRNIQGLQHHAKATSREVQLFRKL